MTENIKTANIKFDIDNNVDYDLAFSPDYIKRQYDKHLGEAAKLHSSTHAWGRGKEKKISFKIKAIVVIFSLLIIYSTYSKYNSFLEEKERKIAFENEKIEKEKQEILRVEQEKQELDAKKSINNAQVVIKTAREKGVEKNQYAGELLKKANSLLDKAQEEFKNKNFKEVTSKSVEAQARANDSISLLEEEQAKIEEKNKKEKPSTKLAQEEKPKKEQKTETKTKTQKKAKTDEPAEVKSEEKALKKEQEEKQKDALKNNDKARELLANIKKELSDENAINLIKKHFSENYSKIEGSLINIEADIDNNKFNSAIELGDKILKEIKEIKKEAEKEEISNEEKRKEALRKILDVQKAMKQKRLEEGK